MTATDATLSNTCRTLEQVGAEFLTWLDDNAERVRQEKAGLTKEFRRLTAQARRIDQAAQRPMCVGVFGPSQSGKSYLISALARKGNAPLLADFAGQDIDFIRDINPEGGRESTGLVTRFTLQPAANATPAAPVQMRLLTQTDLVKILGNTYYADCDHSDDELLTQAQLIELLAGLAPAAQPQPVDPLTAEDVYDLQAYFERYFKGQERVRLLRHGYWEQAAQLAPRLRIQDRAKLFGVIWGGVEAFSQLYIRLYAGLQGLNFAADAGAGLEALLPREQSIIDVQTLKGLGTGSGGTLALTGSNGARVTLPRSEVTALIAELRIVINEQPWDFFQHTDLLDFPGARSREQIKDLPTFLQGADALSNLFLRGKVAYLFERYCAEQELTSMLLCIGPSNQEVKTLPEMVFDWIVIHSRRDPGTAVATADRAVSGVDQVRHGVRGEGRRTLGGKPLDHPAGKFAAQFLRQAARLAASVGYPRRVSQQLLAAESPLQGQEHLRLRRERSGIERPARRAQAD